MFSVLADENWRRIKILQLHKSVSNKGIGGKISAISIELFKGNTTLTCKQPSISIKCNFGINLLLKVF